MQLDLDDSSFRARIASWLQELCDEVVTDLNIVFERSPGIYPTTLLELWRVESQRRGLTPSPISRLTSSDDSPYELLPVGHPVGSDWRFTPESALELVRLALKAVSAGEPVAHLGTPSTFLHCALSDARHQHVLLDRNATVIDALASHGISSPHLMLGIDLQAVGRLPLHAGAVIVDPPWYLDETLLFLSVAAEACRPNATIVLCQPCVGTRPGIDQERALLLDRVSGFGLDPYALLSGGVHYVTPHFEAVSLRAVACGEIVPIAWRRGDVLLFKRSTRSAVIFRLPAQEPQWREVRFGPVRVKLAEQSSGSDIGPLVPGDVLTTVSRRDPVRKRIGLWTSGNRVFTLANPLLVSQLIVLCNTDLMNSVFELRHTLRHAEALGVSMMLPLGFTMSYSPNLQNINSTEAQRMSESTLLDRLVATTSRYSSWSVLRQAIEEARTVHLAVMVEPFLNYILDGKKSIESRFSKHAIAPFHQIKQDDLVLLKLTGGPVVGCFATDSAEFVVLNEEERDRLQQHYSSAICADGDFWDARQDRRYATLVGVRDVQRLDPAPVAKSDRRGWVVLKPRPASHEAAQLTLL